jgi:ribosomal protein RSM22 (predicted rRNA methylase)
MLQAGIDRELARQDRARVSRAALQITSDYKAGRFAGSLTSPEARAAYLLTRLPATFAASQHVFREVRRIVPEFEPATILDLGAGPGTGSWAALEIWPGIQHAVLVESTRSMLEVGQRLASGHEVLKRAECLNRDLQSSEYPAADLVVLSYALGELRERGAATAAAWKATKQLLVIVEPGTPKNFADLAQVRRDLIAAGGHVVAPCPHPNECPMLLANDWCHFAVRLERTSEHRKMKGGALGFEDEKFSYIAFCKSPAPHAAERIVRHPLVHSGHIQLTLCASAGLEKQTITKKNKEAFRAARKAKWGDAWNQFE